MSHSGSAAKGKRLGRYEIERELGRGGMGVVYLARDVNLNRRIALKTTTVTGSSENSRNQRRARFVREVKALSQVNHANVVHVFDAAEADDADLGWLLYYSMEYVEGFTLADLVSQKGALAPDAAASVCAQVAAGLGAAHLLGIVHRDVKPANVFLTENGRALIGDFGICKMEGSTQITRRDQLIGTPNYLAPEQILGDPITAATDVFAIGALYYVIVTHSPLRKKLDAASLLQAAQAEGPSESMLALEHIPLALRKILAKALRRNPDDRQKDCNELAEELTDFAGAIPNLRDAKFEKKSKKEKPAPIFAASAKPIGDISSSQPGQSVEDVAAALLKEVRTAKAKPEKPTIEKEAKLIEAKVESTVMFNLRTLEKNNAASNNPLQKEDAELKVAATESTVMFNLRQLEEQDSPKKTTELDPIDLEHDDELKATHTQNASAIKHSSDPHPKQVDTHDENTPNPTPRVLCLKTTSLPVVKTAAPIIEKKKPVALLAILLASFLAIILGLVFFLLPPEVQKNIGFLQNNVERPKNNDDKPEGRAPALLKEKTKEKTTQPELVAIPILPKKCRAKRKGRKNSTRVARLLDESKTLFQKASYAHAHSLLAKALIFDPRASDVHYLMAKLLIKQKEFKTALEHYRCVIALAPGSKKATTAQKVLKAAAAQ